MNTVTKVPIVNDFAIVCQIITNPLASVGDRPVEAQVFLPIPKNYGSAFACGGDRLPVRAEGDTVDGDIVTCTFMTGQSFHQLAVSGPDLDGSVLAFRGDPLPVQAKGKTHDRAVTIRQGSQQLAAGGPTFNGMIHISSNGFPVGTITDTRGWRSSAPSRLQRKDRSAAFAINNDHLPRFI